MISNLEPGRTALEAAGAAFFLSGLPALDFAADERGAFLPEDSGALARMARLLRRVATCSDLLNMVVVLPGWQYCLPPNDVRPRRCGPGK